MRAIISAAGTGGHINPGIAIANKIKEKEPDSEIIFLGTDRGLETDLVPRAGYELKCVPAYGFKKSLTITNIKHIIQTFSSNLKVRKIIKEFKPDVVIGTGGYICVPASIAAIRSNTPLVFHESNAYPGKAVKLFSKKADLVCAGFSDIEQYLDKDVNIAVTGNPTKVKKLNLTQEEKNSIVESMGLSTKLPIIFVFGGSQGAQSINEAIKNLILNKANKDYQIVWAIGPKNYDLIKEDFSKQDIDIENLENVKAMPYAYNMQELYEIADLLICRSGAMTITEIAIVGRPAIFVPLPSHSANRQVDNAKVLEEIGAAKIILNDELNANILSNMIDELISDLDELKEMGKRANTKQIKDVEEKIYNEIKLTIDKRRSK